MKVLINKCYGGAGLSGEALKEVARRKGVELTYYKANYYENFHDKRYTRIDNPDLKDDHWLSTTTKDMGEVIDNDMLNENYFSEYDLLEDRTDKDIIDVVEEMGDAANGRCAQLRIVEVPDDVQWEIEEYDGIEWIAEVHRTWG